mmetsp:Transcript_26290/g.78541  ORF Transcript_26290/g.78541 Transcript_26290/m.78541 type:complete len:324 (+) Transcript_26290:544-1515(+)
MSSEAGGRASALALAGRRDREHLAGRRVRERAGQRGQRGGRDEADEGRGGCEDEERARGGSLGGGARREAPRERGRAQGRAEHLAHPFCQRDDSVEQPVALRVARAQQVAHRDESGAGEEHGRRLQAVHEGGAQGAQPPALSGGGGGGEQAECEECRGCAAGGERGVQPEAAHEAPHGERREDDLHDRPGSERGAELLLGQREPAGIARRHAPQRHQIEGSKQRTPVRRAQHHHERQRVRAQHGAEWRAGRAIGGAATAAAAIVAAAAAFSAAFAAAARVCGEARASAASGVRLVRLAGRPFSRRVRRGRRCSRERSRGCPEG